MTHFFMNLCHLLLRDQHSKTWPHYQCLWLSKIVLNNINKTILLPDVKC